jgi:hypothetical protein
MRRADALAGCADDLPEEAELAGIVDATDKYASSAGPTRQREQSTHRTQGWVRVTQALDRVRQAARLRKEEKSTALFHHLSVDLFREAFFALKRDAAPGVDGLTWRTYETDLERPGERGIARHVCPRRREAAPHTGEVMGPPLVGVAPQPVDAVLRDGRVGDWIT